MGISHIIVVKTITLRYMDTGLPAFPARVSIRTSDGSEILIAAIGEKYMECVRKTVRNACVELTGGESVDECVENKLIEADSADIVVKSSVVVARVRKDGEEAGFAVRYRSVTWSTVEVVCTEERISDGGGSYL